MTEMTLVAIKVEKKNNLRRNERGVRCRDCHVHAAVRTILYFL